MSQPRQIKDGPWCWQHKEKLTMITDIFDATNDVNSARTIYVALTEFASDNGNETFTVPIAQIARRAGVSYRTAFAILNRFESLKLIAVKRQLVEGTKERAPSTYTMLGNQCITLCDSRNQASLPKVLKKEKEKDKKYQGAAKTFGNSIPNTSHNTSDSFSSGSHQYQNVPAREHPKWPEFAAWCRTKDGTPSEKGFQSWLRKQKPQWRDKVRQNFDGEEGYELDGKFYSADVANRMVEKNSELALKFRQATKRGDAIQVLKPKGDRTR
jgi:molybdenum-dependent DNA-binding transcriptional regulator ModE